jgi:hypothetical protein
MGSCLFLMTARFKDLIQRRFALKPLHQRSQLMPLIWTDPAPGKEGVSHYDHVIAETPLGNIMLEWKSWKDHDDPSGHMPWDEFIVESTLEGAKAAAQDAWDRMAPKILALSVIKSD